MCHCVSFDRPDFLAAVQRYKLSRTWLFVCREREEAQHEEEKRQVNERYKQQQMQHHIKRHLGKLFPQGKTKATVGMEVPEILMQKTLRGWHLVAKEMGNKRMIADKLRAATGGQLPMITKKSRELMLAKKGVDAWTRTSSAASNVRPSESGVRASESGETSCNLVMGKTFSGWEKFVTSIPEQSFEEESSSSRIKLPSISTIAPTALEDEAFQSSTDATDVFTAPALQELIAKMPEERPATTQAWKDFRTEIQNVFSCSDSKAVYGHHPGSWETSYAQKKGPGIPPLPELPWKAKLRLQQLRHSDNTTPFTVR